MDSLKQAMNDEEDDDDDGPQIDIDEKDMRKLQRMIMDDEEIQNFIEEAEELMQEI